MLKREFRVNSFILSVDYWLKWVLMILFISQLKVRKIEKLFPPLETSEIIPWKRKICIKGWVGEDTGWTITLINAVSSKIVLLQHHIWNLTDFCKGSKKERETFSSWIKYVHLFYGKISGETRKILLANIDFPYIYFFSPNTPGKNSLGFN